MPKPRVSQNCARGYELYLLENHSPRRGSDKTYLIPKPGAPTCYPTRASEKGRRQGRRSSVFRKLLAKLPKARYITIRRVHCPTAPEAPNSGPKLVGLHATNSRGLPHYRTLHKETLPLNPCHGLYNSENAILRTVYRSITSSYLRVYHRSCDGPDSRSRQDKFNLATLGPNRSDSNLYSA